MTERSWAYQTADLPPVAARVRERPEDFLVEELPLFAPAGQGEHLWLVVKKTGLTTEEVALRLARALGADPRVIGHAGLKDKHAVTVQAFTVPGATEDAARALAIPGAEVVSVSRHTEKLRKGQSAGNRFRLRLAGAAPGALEAVRAVALVLARTGVPNYYGEQRFGGRRNNHRVGQALLAEAWEAAAALIAGGAEVPPLDGDPRVRDGRAHFDAGDWNAAARSFPPHFRAERTVARHLAARPGDFAGAIRRVDPRQRTFFGNAFQAYLFNCQLEALVLSGASSLTDGGPPDGVVWGARAARHGPVRDLPPGLLAAVLPGVDAERAFKKARLKGDRRPLHLPVEMACEEDPQGIVLSFALPPGAYATAVLREITKDDPPIPRLA